MQEPELLIFIIVSVFIFLSFVIGVVLFVVTFKKRRVTHENEKRRIEDEHIRGLITAQLQSQQQTMQFIGREIHDNIGQKLTLASLYTKQLLSSNNTATEKINTIGNIIDESLADLRQLSKSLTNPAVLNASLAQLLQEEATKINSLGNCFVQITNTAKQDFLQPAQKNILYRMLQEFMQNSLKHAQCKKITITLSSTDNKVQVTAFDDGNGFDTTENHSGQGLANMKRRAEELNAAFNLQSEKEKGTNMIVEIPITPTHEI